MATSRPGISSVMLKALMPEYDITEQDDFLNATWAEYFAVLTIAYYIELSFLLNPPPLPSNSPISDAFNKTIERLGGNTHKRWAVESMEAVCYAEHLQQMAELEKQFALKEKTQISAFVKERGSKGGKVRDAKYKPIKAKVLALYANEYKSRTNRGAAKLIYEKLKTEIDAVLSTDDPVQRLATWIGIYVRSKHSQ